MVIWFPYEDITKTLNVIFSETTHRNCKKISKMLFFSLVSLISYKKVGSVCVLEGAWSVEKTGPKILL